MIAALIILGALVATGAVLWMLDRRHRPEETGGAERNEAPTEERDGADEEQCCGMHITCERDSLLAAVSREREDYDDEELDIYRGTTPDAYSAEAEEEFREVLLTLRPDDIAGWARSIQLRGIELPEAVRDELLMIVGEERMRRNGQSA